MDLSQLSHDEMLALVGLLELIGESDPEVLDDEVDRINAVAEALGPDRYRAIADEVDRRFTDEGEFKAFLSTITRPAARELIYGTTLEAAMGGAIDPRESRLLEWLGKEWLIEPFPAE